MDLHVLWPPESENPIFSIWSMCVCMRIRACVCVCVISITEKQIAAETSNFVLYICIMCKCYLKLFIKIGQKLYLQEQTKEF